MNNKQAFIEAKNHISGGVNSPVRAFGRVGGTPPFIDHADGCRMYDIEGRAFIDYVGSWGPMIMGHNHPDIAKAITEAVKKGVSFGAPTLSETQLASKIRTAIPSIEKIRFVNSGTEATMSALRLARAYTGRNMVAKFAGCYHGHSDALLVKGGSGMLTHGKPDSQGVPAAFTNLTLVLNYNDIEHVQSHFKKYGEQLAAVIIEPVAGNMNCIPADPAFMNALKDLCNQYGTVLIFDEVMSGFRVSLGGAQQSYSIQPDLTCLGKIIGGGLPVGAFGGRDEIMSMLAPQGGVYQAGTLSGNPLCMAAGNKMLELISKEGVYEQLSEKCTRLTDGIIDKAKKHHLSVSCNHTGAMFGLFFNTTERVTRLEQVAAGESIYNKFFHLMLSQGIYFAPSVYEAGFISMAHEDADIDATLNAVDAAFDTL